MAEAAFANQIAHYQYSRFANPTVAMLEQRLARSRARRRAAARRPAWRRCIRRCCAQLKAGDRVVASRALFGSCHWIVSTLLPQYGIEAGVRGRRRPGRLARGAERARPRWCCWKPRPTRCSTSSICARFRELAHAAGAIVVVDNVFATPLLQKPLELGADVVVYSATKHMDGQGRVLGGAVLGPQEMDRGGVPALLPQHRPGAVAVQCLGDPEGAGDDGAARRRAVRNPPRRSRISWRPSPKIARVALSHAGRASAARAGDGADVAAAARW